ncbi:phenol hydroxylase [Pseudomaricurvus alkylphenolicus]|jgi:phenol hydroxylase P1 protein|uniref:aromatic/alkene monooxygenase hydroxylase subunit beta n=1 Tax=Pseudomaricurvus alkylphenolicus TaxID=1306991 RepID=UPI00141E8C5B|nr:aromatic/alkene monooxygenase hydroxylase subunit beta [Pseudomaricurvus alkylphenolicus]NIB42229.1 phenol hydroxylase [Pseudomaricurvus alkylphenolicus]
MQIDIKTADVTPLRQTFKHVQERIGDNKPASRYQEATIALQPEANFHYRPYWDSANELYDKNRTAIVMEDWYAFRDPRQFYYGSWTIARAKQQDSTERNFSFVEQRDLLSLMSDEWRQVVADVLLPLRHVEYGANLNNYYVTSYGYGAAITQLTAFAGMDRLGIAQYLSRIGLILDGNTGELLNQAKEDWLQAERWQSLRRLMEDLLVVEDWFELLVAQTLVLDGLLYPLVYERMDKAVSENGGSSLAMLTEFMSEWFGESKRWVDATLKTAAQESEANREQLQSWINHWLPKVEAALLPVAERVFESEAEDVLEELKTELSVRLKKKCTLELS